MIGKLFASLMKRGFVFVPNSLRDEFLAECEDHGFTACGGAFEDHLYKEAGQYFYR